MRKLEEKFRENTTLKYYNENAIIFSATTQIVDFSITQDKFLALLQPNAYILDFGCGSGRDTKYFMLNICYFRSWTSRKNMMAFGHVPLFCICQRMNLKMLCSECCVH